jgi:hypothetical protein
MGAPTRRVTNVDFGTPSRFRHGTGGVHVRVRGRKLSAKHVTALPRATPNRPGRYAPLMLPGMSMKDIEHFMGIGSWTNTSLSPTGENRQRLHLFGEVRPACRRCS